MAGLGGLARTWAVLSVVLLLLPWLGWHTFNRLEQLTLDTEQQSLRLATQTLARELAQIDVDWQRGGGQGLVAAVDYPLEVDGFADEWPAHALTSFAEGHALGLAQYGSQLYGVLQVPRQQSHQLVLSFGHRQLSVDSPNPSAVSGRMGRHWLSIRRGDDVAHTRYEWRLDARWLAQDGVIQWQDIGEISYALNPPAVLALLAEHAQLGHIQVFQVDGAPLAQGAGTPRLALSAELAINTPDGTVGSVRVSRDQSPAVLAGQSGLRTLLIQISLVIVAIIVFLAGYATRLSRRIGRLQRELAIQLSHGGTVQFTDAGRPDEIGALATDMQRLLGELSRYNRFLVRIPRTLRHELANPMSTVQSSIELLADESDPKEQARLRAAAGRGIEKLNSTLSQITEAANLEDALASDTIYPIDLKALLQDYLQSCRDAFGEYRWALRVPAQPMPVRGNELRVEQMLDKLIDNARSYTPAGGTIQIELIDQVFSADLCVYNQGPPLAEDDEVAAFGLFSGTRNSSDGSHLGLGLFVVGQIAKAMSGRCQIRNAPGGVRVSVLDLPVVQSEPLR